MSERRSRGSSPLRVVASAVAVVAVVVGLAVALVVLVDDGGPGDDRVLIGGDSVTYQSVQELAASFGWAGDGLKVIGVPGNRTDQIEAAIRPEFDDGPPGIVVVVAGYNDLLQRSDPEPAVRSLMELVGGAPCAVWILIPTKGDWDPAAAVAYDDLVTEQAARHPRVHVETGWRDAVDAPPGPAPDPALVDTDEVHPTAAGQARLAEIAAAAIDRDCR